MLKDLPTQPSALVDWTWPEIEPHYRALEARPLEASSVEAWLADWSRLSELLEEMNARLYVAATVNTADPDAEARMKRYLDDIFPASQAAEQKLKEKLLASGLKPAGYEIALRNIQTEAKLFHPDNLELLAEEKKLNIEYDKILGAQTARWEGEEITLTRLAMVFEQPDRARREAAWQLKADRQLADRGAINKLWKEYMALRARIARNAALPSFREYTWQQKLRFDYTPEDCKSFAAAIEQAVVPAATRIYERRRKAEGLASLRPWDLVDGWYSRPTPGAATPRLHPFADVAELKARTSAIFHHLDPVLGGYFDTLLAEGLTDLDNRKNKAPGAYCYAFPAVRKPFVFVNAVGTHTDVATTIHEAGHAFHVFESAPLPYFPQVHNVPMEFAEVASMGMELLASPYLTKDLGGFYSPREAATARIEHLEGMILFWPYMASVDAFQQWVYENPEQGADPDACDAKYGELWDRFLPGLDYSGLEQVKCTGWQRKPHIHQVPFYYVEYGLAQLGAVQIFGNARTDPGRAVADYRRALSLGATVGLPELFQTAGARFAFDRGTLQEAVDLMEGVIAELETEL